MVFEAYKTDNPKSPVKVSSTGVKNSNGKNGNKKNVVDIKRFQSLIRKTDKKNVENDVEE